jgi:anti-sigma B factor antagonist
VDLALSTTTDGSGPTVVHVGGEIDVYTAPALRRELDNQINAGCKDLVVDLRNVTFMDSTGLGVLVGRLKLIRTQGGIMRVLGATERVLKVFTITGLDRVFDIVEDVDDDGTARPVAGTAAKPDETSA